MTLPAHLEKYSKLIDLVVKAVVAEIEEEQRQPARPGIDEGRQPQRVGRPSAEAGCP